MGIKICNAINKGSSTSVPQQNKKFSFGDDQIPSSNLQKKDNLKSNGKYKTKQKIIINPINQKEYKINRLIGRGYYCKVYKCEQGNMSYSIKSILNHKGINNNNTNNANNNSKVNEDIIRSAYSKAVSHMKRDKEIISQLSSQFIIKIIDSFSIDSKPYIVYPYYNIDLFTILKQVKIIPEPIVKVILLQVYIGLSIMHQSNIIYRDLKPENIMIDTTNGMLKIIDFGLSVKGQSEEVLHKEICGTNEYISPEAITGMGYNTDFDWWGLGVLAYELTNGTPPFKGKTQMDIFNAILSQEPAFRDETSNELIDLISYLLKKDKEERISTENIPYHPFFRSVDYNGMLTMTYNNTLRNYVMKYKDYTSVVIDQPNHNCYHKANIY